MILKCKRCGNAWDYKGKYNTEMTNIATYVSCSKCHALVKRDKIEATLVVENKLVLEEPKQVHE